MTSLQRSILATVAYFDLFDYPLTQAELWHNLWQPPVGVTFADVQITTSTLQQLRHQEGVITFIDRAYLTQVRAERYLESDRKYKKRLPYIRLLTYLPWVQAIFIVNSLAYYNASEQSDIDLLIVAQTGKIWTTRFFTTAFAKILGLRPRPDHTKDTLCLSFYLTADATNLQTLNTNIADAHQAYWLSHIYPVYDPSNIIARLIQTNLWLKQLLPFQLTPVSHPKRMIKQTWLHHVAQSLLGVCASETVLKKIQLAVMPKKLKTLNQNPEQLVIMSPELLKFHTRDPRPELEQKWLERIKKYSVY